MVSASRSCQPSLLHICLVFISDVQPYSNDSVLFVAVPDIEVGFPSDERIRYIIDTMALYVIQDGCPFEQAVMLKEQNNPEFRYLFDFKTPEHAYYRWRLYALANEDSMRSWRVEPFCMVEDTSR